jgi:hypothetical protein
MDGGVQQSRSVAESTGGKSDEPEIEARYANFFEIGVNDAELLLCFGQQYEGTPSRIHTRIVTVPVFARHFLKLLQDAIAVDVPDSELER